MLTIKQAIEALVFASPKPLTIEEIRKALRGAAAETEELDVIAMGDATDEEVASQLNLLRAEYEQTGRSFQLVEQATGWTFATVPASAQWVRQLYPESRPTRLSGPALETLAIIAYRQPVTRADIEAVRGVAVDGVMQVLLDRGLVKIAGRAEMPGRPLLYQTTDYFLEHFGLKDVEELPNSDELRRVPLPKAEVPTEEAAADGEKPKKGRKKKDADAAATEAPASGDTTPENPAGTPSGAHDAAISPDAAPADPASDAAVIEEVVPEGPIESAPAEEPVAQESMEDATSVDASESSRESVESAGSEEPSPESQT
jgi:segregation and condensation protein B